MKYIFLLIFIFGFSLGFGQVMTFKTFDEDYSGNVFLHNNKFYEETDYLRLYLDLDEYKISRKMESVFYASHPISWTDEVYISDNHILWVIKTQDGWQFYINFIDRKLSFMRLVDKYNRETKYIASHLSPNN